MKKAATNTNVSNRLFILNHHRDFYSIFVFCFNLSFRLCINYTSFVKKINKRKKLPFKKELNTPAPGRLPHR